MQQKITKAVIPAAGLGTRFLPATKAMPKEMMPIVDKPAIQYIIEEAVASGITDILIITGRGKRAIEDHFDRSYELEAELQKKGNADIIRELNRISSLASIHYIRQGKPLGLGHAILKAREHVGNEPFAVFLGDDLVKSEEPCMKKMMEIFSRTGFPVVAVSPVEKSEIPKYGIVKARQEGSELIIEDMVEKPAAEKAPSNLAILGRYILTPDIFGILEKTKPGANGEINLTDALRTLGRKKKIYGYRVEGKWMTVGDRMSYLKTVVEYALDRKDVGPEFLSYLRQRIK
ncbi:UTP--glucose-1-phosphate uridylyltransferase [Candidatus Woesearchaeota archaeon CG07_land_8_20_14_0_80_44_23]|nr:MAG: UTP--glucose-1-phosphate uridylyltransferase [Candidatus Woesearchaeota archaeon CG07_land_8_20_14_0_80_44_23]